MRARKRALCIFLSAVLLFAAASALAAEDHSGETVILFSAGLRGQSGAPAIEKWKTHYEGLGANVLVLSSGGNFYGADKADEDEGMSVLEAMNASGYTAAAVGVSDLEYGVKRLIDLGMGADFPLLCCNLTSKAGEFPFAPSALYEKVGVVGFCSPEAETLISDDKLSGYSFNGDLADIFIQQAVDEVIAQGAETVIVLANTAPKDESKPWRGEDLIPHLKGVDIWIDLRGGENSSGEGVKMKDNEGMELLCLGADEALTGCVIFDGISYEASYLDNGEAPETAKSASAPGKAEKTDLPQSRAEKKQEEKVKPPVPNDYPAPTGANTGYRPAYQLVLMALCLVFAIFLSRRRA